MLTIWKFTLSLGLTTLSMPRGAKVLSAQVQRDTVCLWACVDTTEPLVTRRFEIVGTGHPMDRIGRSYISTTLMDGGQLVWHVFELA